LKFDKKRKKIFVLKTASLRANREAAQKLFMPADIIGCDIVR